MVGWHAYKLEYHSKFNKRLKKLNDQLSKENLGFTKKEILKFGKEKKNSKVPGGIAEMKKPRILFL